MITFELIHLDDECCIVVARDDETGEMAFGVDVARERPNQASSG